MDKPKISILVPSFNQGKYISSLVRSVLGQSYSNWELIIQDGGSKDETTEVCERFAAQDNRIFYRTEKDSGFAEAVNRAIDRATGTVGIIQSSDDFFATPNALSEASGYFINNPDLVLLGGGSVVVDDQLLQLAVSERVAGYATPESVYKLQRTFSQSATFFSMARARAVGKLDLSVDMVADTDFWIRIATFDQLPFNGILQTSQIWGAALVQPNQRSANFTKFYAGRAKMFTQFIENQRIPFSIDFKKEVASSVIVETIRHFTMNGIDTAGVKELYNKVNGKPYVAPQHSMRVRISRSLRGIKDVRTPNTIQEIYFAGGSKSTMYNHGWFNRSAS